MKFALWTFFVWMAGTAWGTEPLMIVHLENFEHPLAGRDLERFYHQWRDMPKQQRDLVEFRYKGQRIPHSQADLNMRLMRSGASLTDPTKTMRGFDKFGRLGARFAGAIGLLDLITSTAEGGTISDAYPEIAAAYPDNTGTHGPFEKKHYEQDDPFHPHREGGPGPWSIGESNTPALLEIMEYE